MGDCNRTENLEVTICTQVLDYKAVIDSIAHEAGEVDDGNG